MESSQDKSKEQTDQNPVSVEDKKKEGEVRAAAALKSLLSKPNAKENLYAVLKALTAMKLQKNDPYPNLVICSNSAKELRITDLDESESFLFQGSIGAAYNKEKLDEAKITHILTCASNINPRFPKDFTYKVLPLLDKPDENIKAQFDSALEFLNEARMAGGRVLVHCFAGKSRASTITLSYMMTEMHLNLKESFEHLKNKRPIACPNIGFVMQLMGHEKKVFGYNSSLEALKLDAAKAAKDSQVSEQKELQDAAQLMAQKAAKQTEQKPEEEKK